MTKNKNLKWYVKVHDEIIKRAKTRKLHQMCEYTYTERHHIIPKCMGGDNSEENIAVLTGREHFVIHQLLAKIYPNNFHLNNAAWIMASRLQIRERKDGMSRNRQYEWLKERRRCAASTHSKNLWKNPKIRKKMIQGVTAKNRFYWSDENPNKEKVEQTRKKISASSKKFYQENPEHYEKMHEANMEYWSNPENKKKQSERVKGRKNPHYGKHWYYNPDTLHSARYKPEEVPEGYVKGRLSANNNFSVNSKNKKCIVCNSNSGSPYRKYCDEHRPRGCSTYSPEPKVCQICGINTGSKYKKYCDTHRKEREKELGQEWAGKNKIYTENAIIEAVKRNKNLHQTCLDLGMKVGGKDYKTIKEVMEKHNLTFDNKM